MIVLNTEKILVVVFTISDKKTRPFKICSKNYLKYNKNHLA